MEQQIVSKEIFSKRFSEMLDSSSETTYSIADRLSLTPASISRYANGIMAPKVPTVYMMASIFNVNPLWLMGYDAPKFQKDESSPLYSSEAQKLAQDYDSLDGHGKKVIRLVADEEMARCAEQAQTAPVRATTHLYVAARDGSRIETEIDGEITLPDEDAEAP